MRSCQMETDVGHGTREGKSEVLSCIPQRRYSKGSI
jgi:hypothetical protein